MIGPEVDYSYVFFFFLHFDTNVSQNIEMREREREMIFFKYIQVSYFEAILERESPYARATALLISKMEQVQTNLDIANNRLGIRNRWLKGVFCKKR